MLDDEAEDYTILASVGRTVLLCAALRSQRLCGFASRSNHRGAENAEVRRDNI